ncbi:carboxypeptidase-like regulatory domain-containing protein, partial [Streptomyces sp. NPDC000188]|uniref:carboxypeptidase-like regulatory domain-containing protein n=1 Tax=Streptomyces sp. NPDC000188 TaxID=3154245 RepID=UPI00331B2CF9
MGLSARIRTRDGWALPHAVVTVTDMTGAQVLRAEADDEGAVHDAVTLTPGPYVVIVTAVGYAPTASTAMVTASGPGVVGARVGGGRGGRGDEKTQLTS